MLKYIVTVTEDLFMLVTLITLLYAFCGMQWGRKGRSFIWAGIGTGLAASAAMAIVKNTTRLIYTNQWNLWVFVVTIAVTVLYLIFSILFGRKKQSLSGVGGTIACLLAAAVSALLLFYEVPDVFAYPVLFDTAGNGIISVNYLVRLIGWALALILLLVYSRYLYKCTVALGHRGLLVAVLDLGLITNAVRCFGQALRPWLTRGKWLPDFLPTYSKAEYPWVFPFSSFIANNEVLLNIIIGGLALLIPIVLFLRNLRITEAYNNPAEHRKLKSICRRNRRQAVTVVVCFVLVILSLTVVKAYDSRVIELSAPESYTIVEDDVHIPLTLLEDGHLHRFEYTGENGIAIRWIVILKPGSAAYGVGLDACEVCGDAGYFERSGQVICKRCDVVMNINTIGFKGGCNPIPLAYRIADGQMVITIEDILAGEKEFK